jgi:hypothetical protein
MQVLREVTLSARQPIGLEPWGRMKVEYEGLHAALPWIQRNANSLGMPAEDLRDGVAALLDYLRRKRALHDPEREIFTKYWMDGDLEIQQGYLPQLGGPVGTKFRRADGEDPKLVTQWLSDRGDTTIRQMARKWWVQPDAVEPFLEGLFKLLKDTGLCSRWTRTGCGSNRITASTAATVAAAGRLDERPGRHASPGAAMAGSSSSRRTRTTTTCNSSTRSTRCCGRRSTRRWCRTRSASASRTCSRARATQSTASSVHPRSSWASTSASSMPC